MIYISSSIKKQVETFCYLNGVNSMLDVTNKIWQNILETTLQCSYKSYSVTVTHFVNVIITSKELLYASFMFFFWQTNIEHRGTKKDYILQISVHIWCTYFYPGLQKVKSGY